MQTTLGVEGSEPFDSERVEVARVRGLSNEDAARLSSLLSLLSDPVRVRVLYALDLVDELCVGDLALCLGVSEDAVGYGLRLLRTAGLVHTRKAGRAVFYRLADHFPEPLLEHCLRELIHLSRLASDDSESERTAGVSRGARSSIRNPGTRRVRGTPVAVPTKERRT